jgi:outer membrane protein assembly factor BamB
MRLFSISIFVLLLALQFCSPKCWGADTDDPESVRGLESLWTRKSGNDWPRMLNQNYDSRSLETGILKRWPNTGLKVVWTVDTGTGYGNGVASQGRWFQFDRVGNLERLSCLNAETGKPIWNWTATVDYRDAYGYNNGPRCSPVVDGDRVYVLGVTGTLACIAIADGSTLWELHTNDEYNVVPNFFGVGASPLIYQDKLLVMIGGSSNEQRTTDITAAKPQGTAMVAFDKMTGKEIYRVGKYLASYSAPVIHKIQGQDVCLAFVREGLLAFDPTDGSNEAFFPWRAKVLESVNAASPVVWKDRVLLSEAYERGSVLVKRSTSGFSQMWVDGATRREQLLRSHWSTPLLDGDDLYASSGRNEPDTDLRCVTLQELETDKERVQPSLGWFERNHDRMTGLLVDGHALMLGESGLLQLLELNPKKQTVVAEMALANTIDLRDRRSLVQTPCWAPPVLAHGLLYVRGAGKVVCLELIPE